MHHCSPHRCVSIGSRGLAVRFTAYHRNKVDWCLLSGAHFEPGHRKP